MDHFAATVRIGDADEHRTPEQVDEVLRLHFETGCWSSARGREIHAGMPVIASHTGGGRGQFLVGVFTGEADLDVPWPRAAKHADHVGYGVTFMDAVFEADPDAVPGAGLRSIRWLSSDEFTRAMHAMRATRPVPTGD
jgi:hypothetical protein